jgi:hypothetical protein
MFFGDTQIVYLNIVVRISADGDNFLIRFDGFEQFIIQS